MIELGELRAKSVHVLKDATFKFEPGVTHVLGRNLNRGANASNASGKSLLLSLLPNLLLNSAMLAGKNRAALKDPYSKDTLVGVDFKVGKIKFTATKTAKAVQLLKNGVAMKVRTKDLFKTELEKLLQTNEEEFFSLYYLDSSRPNSFLTGTAASRFSFFTDMFRLKELDSMRRWLAQSKNELAQDATVAERIEQELSEIKRVEIDPIETEYNAALSTQKSVLPKLKELQTQLHLVQTAELLVPMQTKFDALKQKVGELTLRQVTDQLTVLRAELSDAKAASKARKARREIAKRLDALPVDTKLTPKKLRRLADAAAKLEGKLTTAIEDAEDLTLLSKSELAKARAIKGSLDEWRKVSDTGLLRARKDLAAFDKAFTDDADTCACPLCASVLSSALRKKLRKKLALEVEQQKTHYETAQANVKLLAKLEQHEQNAELVTKAEEAKRKLSKLTAKYPVKELRHAANLIEQLAELPESKTEVDTEKLAAKIERLESLKDDLMALQSIKQELRQLEDRIDIEAAASINREAVKSELKKLSRTNDLLAEKIPGLRAKLDLAKERKQRRIKLTKELEEVKQRIEDLPLYDALIDAYGKSGIKLLLIRKIAGMIEANLNRYAKLLYTERYTFTIKVGSNQFDVLASRQHNKAVSTSDIRTLSGAERRLFSLLFLMSVLPLIPDSRRLDTLILDEPEQNMDPPMIAVMRSKLLPELAKVVPKLVVISTSEVLVRPGDRIVTVVKSGNVSSLVHGRYIEKSVLKKAA